jgi:class 3 adenylate cyclase
MVESEKHLIYANTDFFEYSISKQHVDKRDESVTESRRNTEYLVEFMTQSQRYVVGTVDMVNSSKISAQIGPVKSARYYQVFLNSMSKILCQYGGVVIKNAGDCLFYYFPESEKTDLASCIECSLEMIRSQKYLSEQLASERLPHVDFRVSADYGTVLLMKTSITDTLDLIGPPVNMCSKINKLAEKNQFVIGGDLFQMVKEFKAYRFKHVGDFSLGFKLSYPIYSVSDK